MVFCRVQFELNCQTVNMLVVFVHSITNNRKCVPKTWIYNYEKFKSRKNKMVFCSYNENINIIPNFNTKFLLNRSSVSNNFFLQPSSKIFLSQKKIIVKLKLKKNVEIYVFTISITSIKHSHDKLCRIKIIKSIYNHIPAVQFKFSCNFRLDENKLS